MINPVILAGGSGSRLWPASREHYPKQFLKLFEDDQSLFQSTVLRASSLKNASSPIIICNEEHRFLVAEQLRNIDIIPQAILLEPTGKNTAPAITLAALYIKDRNDTLLVLPADHVLNDTNEFISLINNHQNTVNGGLTTFGIQTSFPSTGYGYIKKGKKVNDLSKEFSVDRFIEKPDIEKAIKFHEDDSYLWNSGMFLFKTNTILEEIQKFNPEIIEHCSAALKFARKDLDFVRIDEASFNLNPNISIDYAVMEHTKSATVLPLISEWSDVGIWSSIWSASNKDSNSNSIYGDVITYETNNSLIHSHSRLVATLGIENHIIVETPDAVLVSHKDQSQNIKHIVNTLINQKRSEATAHKRVYRPWGWYESIANGPFFQAKLIQVMPEGKLSLQKHMKRAEHWIIVKGEATVTNNEEVRTFHVNESTYIPVGIKHRLENLGKDVLQVIEIQTGSYLGEDDIVRFEDQYNR